MHFFFQYFSTLSNCSKRKIRDLLTADFAWLCAAAPDFDFGILVTTPFMCTVVLKFPIKFFWRKKIKMLRSKNLSNIYCCSYHAIWYFVFCHLLVLVRRMLLFYDLVLFFFVFRCCFIKTENITRFWDNIPLLLPPLKTHHCIRLTFFKLDFANIVPKISFAPYKKF